MNLEMNVPEQSSVSPALYFADKETEPREGPRPRCCSGRVRSWPKLPRCLGTWCSIHMRPGCCLRWCRGSRPCSIATVLWLPSVLLQMLPCGSCEIISFCSIILDGNLAEFSQCRAWFSLILLAGHLEGKRHWALKGLHFLCETKAPFVSSRASNTLPRLHVFSHCDELLY